MGKFRQRTTVRRHCGDIRPQRFALEGLESRCLLSATVVPATADATISTGVAGYTPAQIIHAYGFDATAQAFGTAGGNGAGQTIAIVEAYNDSSITADLHQFDEQYGLADPVVQQLNQNGGTALPGSNLGWSQETALDVEWAHAIAPGANIVVVEAQSDQLSDLLTAVDTARHLEGVSVVSMSWGVDEFAGETAFDNLFTTPANHQNITFVASTGDRSTASQVQWPAASPNVVAVGGTTLTVAGTADATAQEAPWNGTIAGVSQYEPALPFQGSTFRIVPDVVYDANPIPGFSIYDTSHGGWMTVGGTSAGAPQWAALIAIADQARTTDGEATLDGPTQTLPTLYIYYRAANLGAAFTTVTFTYVGSRVNSVVPDGSVTITSGMLTASNGAVAYSAFSANLAYSVIGTLTSAASPAASSTTPMGPAVPIDPKLLRNRQVHRFVLNVNVRPISVFSSASPAHFDHPNLASMIGSSPTLTRATSELGGIVVGSTAPAATSAASLFTAAFSAALAAQTRQAVAFSQAFSGLFTAASGPFDDSPVVPVGTEIAAPLLAQTSFSIAHLNVTRTFSDRVAAFINECAARPQPLATIPEPAGWHVRAWTITGIVAAIDLLILYHLAWRRRDRAKSVMTVREQMGNATLLSDPAATTFPDDQDYF